MKYTNTKNTTMDSVSILLIFLLFRATRATSQTIDKICQKPVEVEEVAEDECVDEGEHEEVVELELGEQEERQDDEDVHARVRPLGQDLEEERQNVVQRLRGEGDYECRAMGDTGN